MVRTGYALVTVLLVLLVAYIVWTLLGGSVDINADVRAPQVEVEPGSLPDINVEPAPEADAGG